MKTNSLRGSLCLCLLLPLQATLIYAQAGTQQQPGTPPAPQQPGTPATSQQPAPPVPQPQTTAPSASQQPAQTPAAKLEMPLNTGDAKVSLELFYWLTSTAPDLRGGAADVNTYPGNLKFPSSNKRTPGAVLGFPAGLNNTVRISYFEARGSSNTVAGQTLTIFNTDFNPGDYLVTRFTMQNVKISYDYLSFPFPADPNRFRLTTLWQVQYTTVNSSVDAPLKPVLADASGNPIPNTGAGTKWFIYPTFGLGLEKAVSGRLRFEVKASGFTFPHRSVIGDVEGSAVLTAGQFELVAGYKLFHFKTSPKADQYLAATLSGAFVGLRWYPRFR
jgi:hypothetical protein